MTTKTRLGLAIFMYAIVRALLMIATFIAGWPVNESVIFSERLMISMAAIFALLLIVWDREK